MAKSNFPAQISQSPIVGVFYLVFFAGPKVTENRVVLVFICLFKKIIIMSEFLKSKVNVAVQVLPTAPTKAAYDVVDEAIAVIANAGIKYRVTPFETVMEGSYDELMEIVKQVQIACFKAGAEKVMCYVKVQSNASEDVTIEDKMEKYDN